MRTTGKLDTAQRGCGAGSGEGGGADERGDRERGRAAGGGAPGRGPGAAGGRVDRGEGAGARSGAAGRWVGAAEQHRPAGAMDGTQILAGASRSTSGCRGRVGSPAASGARAAGGAMPSSRRRLPRSAAERRCRRETPVVPPGDGDGSLHVPRGGPRPSDDDEELRDAFERVSSGASFWTLQLNTPSGRKSCPDGLISANAEGTVCPPLVRAPLSKHTGRGGGPDGVGSSAGRYLVFETLGEGATGLDLRRLRPRSSTVRVAIKVLKPVPRRRATRLLQSRLLREAQAHGPTGRTRTSIVTTRRRHHSTAHVFLAMELVEGNDAASLPGRSGALLARSSSPCFHPRRRAGSPRAHARRLRPPRLQAATTCSSGADGARAGDRLRAGGGRRRLRRRPPAVGRRCPAEPSATSTRVLASSARPAYTAPEQLSAAATPSPHRPVQLLRLSLPGAHRPPAAGIRRRAGERGRARRPAERPRVGDAARAPGLWSRRRGASPVDARCWTALGADPRAGECASSPCPRWGRSSWERSAPGTPGSSTAGFSAAARPRS